MNAPSLARKLSLSVLSALAGFLVIELIARAAEPGPMSLYDSSPYLRIWGGRHRHHKGFEGQWDGTHYDINSRGWRGPEVEPSFDDSEYRVLALGDSCTFGKGVTEQDTWPRQFETLLQEELGAGSRPIVVNAGVNGYSARDYVEVFREESEWLRPQLVVIGFNLNDFPNIVQKVDLAVYQNRENLRGQIPWQVRENIGKFASLRWLRATYYEWNRTKNLEQVERTANAAAPDTPETLARFEEESKYVEEIVLGAREMGAQVVLFLFPYESMVVLDEFDLGPVDRLKALAQRLDVPYVAMEEVFRSRARESDPQTRLFLRGDRYHPNELGYSLVARNVLERAKAEGWLTAAGR